MRYSKVPEEYKADFHAVRILDNVKHLSFLPYLVAGLSFLYLLKYRIADLSGNELLNVQHYRNIFIVMIFLSLGFVVFGLFMRKKAALKMTDYVHHIYLFMLFILCVSLTLLDLQESEDYTGYTVGLLILAFVLRTEPWKFLVISLIGIVFFIVSLLFGIFIDIDLNHLLPVIVISVLSMYVAVNREDRAQDLYLLRKQFEEAAVRDPLTNVFNRRYMIEFLNKELAKFRRTRIVSSIILIDIDHFKRINDEYDHSTGDSVLKQFSEIINENIRDTDLFCRYGGEEFLIILTGADRNISFKIAERIRMKIAHYSFPELSHNVTISIGVAIFTEGDDEMSLIKRADHFLYKAKNSGRNQTCI